MDNGGGGDGAGDGCEEDASALEEGTHGGGERLYLEGWSFFFRLGLL